MYRAISGGFCLDSLKIEAEAQGLVLFISFSLKTHQNY